MTELVNAWQAIQVGGVGIVLLAVIMLLVGGTLMPKANHAAIAAAFEQTLAQMREGLGTAKEDRDAWRQHAERTTDTLAGVVSAIDKLREAITLLQATGGGKR